METPKTPTKKTATEPAPNPAVAQPATQDKPLDPTLAKPRDYPLTPGEQQLLSGVNLRALNAKAGIYDLQVQLEAARAELSASQKAFDGVLSALLTSRNIATGRVTSDFTRLIPQ